MQIPCFLHSSSPLFEELLKLSHEEFFLIDKPDDEEFWLEFDGTTPTLFMREEEGIRKFVFSLDEALLYHRRKNYKLTAEPLARAIGLHKKRGATVIDATCGAGADSMLLYSFGARVIAFERSLLVFTLLKGALEKLALPQDRFELHYGDFKNATYQADALYYDPMYPPKKKSALPKLEMQIFHKFLDPEIEDRDFFEIAFKKSSRVIIKRPIKESFFAGVKPSASFEGKSTRYDLYIA